jgi:hypothetical protein
MGIKRPRFHGSDPKRNWIAGGNRGGFSVHGLPLLPDQFDQVQSMMAGNGAGPDTLPSILYAQLLGLCMGVDEKSLGLQKNQVAMDNITSFITQE